MRRTASDIFDIGQKLTEVKQQLGHGSFMSWLKSEFNWSVSAATRFMQVSEQFKFINLVNSDIAASALYELAAPSTPMDARAEAIERALKGEPITYFKAREIVNRYQELIQSEADQSVIINVDALWQVLADRRISLEKLALSTWSGASLKRLNAAALEELKKRHQIARL